MYLMLFHTIGVVLFAPLNNTLYFYMLKLSVATLFSVIKQPESDNYELNKNNFIDIMSNDDFFTKWQSDCS